tara:strand:+ start:812 stop:1237 length:426 start_codon:yes stop_codon:yes gene_type:complete
MTKIENSLIEAYENTNYYIYHDTEIIINIAKKNIDLINLFKDKNLISASIITAYNPFSKIMTEEQNLSAQLQLKKMIEDSNLSYLDAIGQDIKKEWPGEPSFFIENISKENAIKLGRKFNQNAIVWVDKNLVPELIFCFLK